MSGGVNILLTNVKIINYRCHIDTEFPLSDLTILIGENDSGKSTALTAIEWALNQSSKKLTLDDIPKSLIQQDSFTISVQLTFQVDPANFNPDYIMENNTIIVVKKQQIKNKSFVPPVLEIMKKSCKYSKSDIFSGNAGSQKQKLQELAQLIKGFAIDDASLQNDKKRKETYELICDKMPNEAKKKSFVPLEDELIKMKLPHVEFYSSSSFNEPENVLHNTLKRSFDHTLSKPELSAKVKDLQIALNDDIRQEEKRLFDSIKAYDSSIDSIKIIPDIDFSNSLKRIKIQLKRNEQILDLNLSGDGTKRRIFLGLIEADKKQSLEEANANVIKLYDEPDTSLHYSAEIKLFTNLRAMSKHPKNQIIIATHSINIANQVSLSSLILFSLDYSNMRTLVRHINNMQSHSTTLHTLGKILGIDNIMYYYTKCFIFVEGISEKTAFPGLFETFTSESLISLGISLISYNGSQLETLCDFIRNSLNNNYILVADTDKKTDSNFIKCITHLKEKRIFFIGKKEFEDLFSDYIISTCLNELHPKKNGNMWLETEISSCRGDNFVNELTKQIHEQSENNFKKPEFAEKVAGICSKDDIPETIVDIFTTALKYSNIGR